MARRSARDAFFRPDPWWDEQDIELLKRTSVTALELGARTAKLSDKQQIEFGKALLATGANVRRLDVPGCHLEHVYYLRTLGNADSIRAGVADAQDVVMIGGSYIACEVAASLTAIGKRCTIVMQESATLERGFGARVGRYIQSLLEGAGITVHGQDELERLEGADGRVRTVVTRSGLELAADAVVIGAGVTPDVQLAKRAGLATGERGGVRLLGPARDAHARHLCRRRHLRVRLTPARASDADRALGRRLQPGQDSRAQHARSATSHTKRFRTSTRSSPDSASSNTSAPPCGGTRRSCVAPSIRAASPTGTCRTGGSWQRSPSDDPMTSTRRGGCLWRSRSSMHASKPHSGVSRRTSRRWPADPAAWCRDSRHWRAVKIVGRLPWRVRLSCYAPWR